MCAPHGGCFLVVRVHMLGKGAGLLGGWEGEGSAQSRRNKQASRAWQRARQLPGVGGQ